MKRQKKIHEQPLIEDFETLSDDEAAELALADEQARLEDGFQWDDEDDPNWVTLSDEELIELERPDNGQSKLQAWYREPLWSEVLPGLWQGGTDSRDETLYGRAIPEARIKPVDFDTVITMYGYAQPVDWQVKEFRLAVYDSDMRDFDASELFDLVRVAHTDWQKGKKVLIRCQAGWNRSGLVMALVLMRHGYTADQAINLIRETRSRNALCNRHFEEFLRKQDPRVWQGESYGVAKPIEGFQPS